MATKQQIKDAILAVAGNPESGVIYELSDKWAAAIVDLDADVPAKPTSKDGNGSVQEGTVFERSAEETRVTKPVEKR